MADKGNMLIRIDNSKKRAYRRKFNKMYKKVEAKELEFDKLLVSFASWKSHVKFCTEHGIFNYYEKKIKELILKMTINEGYYVSERTSSNIPVAKKDLNTFYLPVNVEKNEDGMYQYQEYRFNLPIDYNIPSDIIEYLAYELDK